MLRYQYRIAIWLVVAIGAVCFREAFLLTKQSITAHYLNKAGYLGDDRLRFALTPQQAEARAVNFSGVACQRNQIVLGQWVPETLPKPPYVVTTKHLRCYPQEYYKSKGGYQTYMWQPLSNCEFNRYDPKLFCQRTKHKVVSIVGDSLSWEHYRSLVELQHNPIKQGFQHQSRELGHAIVQHVCDGNTAVVFQRDDRLQNVTEALQKANSPDILVLNRGAHYVPDDVLLPEVQMVIDEVRAWLTDCQADGRDCQFYWRTSVPGHPGCTNSSRPAKSMLAMERMVADRTNEWYDDYKWRYHWYDYQRQNELVLAELSAANLTSLHIIDAYKLNMLRPDEHRSHQDDCLHNCYPGKMDVYNQLLLHYLQQQYQQQRDNESSVSSSSSSSSSRAKAWPVLQNTVYDPEATAAARKVREDHKLEKEKKRLHKQSSIQLLLETAGFDGR